MHGIAFRDTRPDKSSNFVTELSSESDFISIVAITYTSFRVILNFRAITITDFTIAIID